MSSSSTAKLFMHGSSQAVRLPKEFRFEGTEVRVSKVGDKVILEPLKKQPFDAAAWRAKLEEYRDIPWRTVAIKAPSSTRRPDACHRKCRRIRARAGVDRCELDGVMSVPTRPLPVPLAGAAVVWGVGLRDRPGRQFRAVLQSISPATR